MAICKGERNVICGTTLYLGYDHVYGGYCILYGGTTKYLCVGIIIYMGYYILLVVRQFIWGMGGGYDTIFGIIMAHWVLLRQKQKILNLATN